MSWNGESVHLHLALKGMELQIEHALLAEMDQIQQDILTAVKKAVDSFDFDSFIAAKVDNIIERELGAVIDDLSENETAAVNEALRSQVRLALMSWTTEQLQKGKEQA
jgi:hypothetical protein